MDVKPCQPMSEVLLPEYPNKEVAILRTYETWGGPHKKRESKASQSGKRPGFGVVVKFFLERIMRQVISVFHKQRERPATGSGNRYWPSEGKPSNPRHELHFAPDGI